MASTIDIDTQAALEESFDPILLSVLANRLDGVCREMNNTLLRAGRSAVLAGARDFSCAVVTSENELLASAEGLPVHVIGIEFLAEAMTDLHDDITEGDAFLHNDPYLGNTHAADHTILVPVFFEGEHVFTACAKAHQADCGNALPTTYVPGARDVYEEGALIFPCVRIQRDYEDVRDIIRMCQRRIRVPELWYGDYLAALGAARVGERSLKRLCEKYGVPTVRRFVEEWFDYSERRMTEAIGALPAGTLVAAGRHDPYPGLDDGLPLQVKVDIKPDEGRIVVDARDNPDCYPGGLNESKACATNNMTIGVFNSLDPDIPHNAGSFRRIDVLLRENCVAGIPVHPTSCSMATTNVADRLVNLTQTAFAELGEGFGLAEGAMGLPPHFAVISGRDSRRGGAPYVNQLFLGSAGGPGSPYADGSPTYFLPVAGGAIYRDNVEIDEQKYPLIVHDQRIVEGGGGAGTFRGAPGCLVAFGPRDDSMTIAYSAEAYENAPRGVRGGCDGAASDVWKLDAQGRRSEVPKVGVVELAPGERIVGVTCGGGGYGDPLARDPELVRVDVEEGWVSADEASAVYGVVVRQAADGATELDTVETRALRASRVGT